VACIFEPTAAAHDRLQVGHQKSNVVERIVVRVAKGDAVVVAVAAHEGHDAGAIGQYKAQGLFKKDTCGFNRMAVQHSMRQSKGLILRDGCIVCTLCIAMHNFSANQSGKPVNQFLIVVVWGW
jgi:hypothetical protein